jgi:S1-C subfamily serine protease
MTRITMDPTRKNRLIKFIVIIAVLALVALACQSPISLQEPAPIEVQTTEVAVQVEAPQEVNSGEPTVQIEVQEESAPVSEPSSVVITSDTYLASGEALSAVYENAVRGVVSLRVLSDLGDGQGSGFVLDQEGHIVTNYHVVEGATAIEVGFWNGLKVRGEVIGTDLDSDLAVVQVDVPDEQLHPLELGDSDQLRVGEVVVAIGSPFGLGSSMTVGVLSAKGRVLTSLNESDQGGFFSAGDLLQTDAAINPGNSGGPLLNMVGQVIGLNRAIRTENFTNDGSPLNSGIGFAISVKILHHVIPSLIENGSYEYPLLGVSSLPEITVFDQEQLNLPQTTGALVVTVPAGGPADQADVQVGDLITHIDGIELLNFGELLSYLLTEKQPGDDVALTIWRAGETLEITVTLGSRD